MKFNYLIKASPFLSTLILIIFLSISNQKEYTKLRILIWNTPTLTLGTYLAISTGTGFILSYFITSNLAKIKLVTPIQSLKFKEKGKYDDISESTDINTNESSDKTLIERNINDPSPTINANFRIIGRSERNNINFINNDYFNNDISSEYSEKYDEQTEINEVIKQVKSINTDWDDESYTSW